MIEPTESEDVNELDRFIWSMLSIRAEMQEIIDGKADKQINLLKSAPFTLSHLMDEEWNYSFTR